MKERSAFGTRSQIFGRRAANAYRYVLFALICLCVLGSACNSVKLVSCPGNQGATAFLDEIIFTDKKLESKLAVDFGLLPSEEFWFYQGDRDLSLVYGWGELEYHERDAELESCNYSVQSEGCLNCSSCANSCNDSSTPPRDFQTQPFATLTKTDAAGNLVVLHDFSTKRGGCLDQPRPEIKVEDSVTYALSHRGFVCPNLDGLQQTFSVKAQIVNTPEPIEYDLEPYVDRKDRQTLRFRFKMPEIGGRLSQNFSPSLRVTKARVLLKTTDRKTGMSMVERQDPVVLERVRPSRISFLPVLNEDDIERSPDVESHRCFVDPTRFDGGFDLTRCRTNTETIPDVRPRAPVTPVYEIGHPTPVLTWVIEYKTADGISMVPTFINNDEIGELPILELTIELAVQ